MIGSFLHGLTIVRQAVAITIVMGAAGATVAGSVDMSGGHAAAAAPSRAATMTTSASNETTTNHADEAKAETKTEAKTETKAEAKTETKAAERIESAKPSTSTRELSGLLTACVATHERASEPCQKALALSGLGAEEFWTKVSALLAKAASEHKPQTQPSPATDTAALAAVIKDCLARYAVAKNSAGDASLASEACRKAVVASGLSSTDFWTRFGPKTETKTPAPTRKPEETRKPTTTGTTTTIVTTAQLEVMVKDCFTKYLITRNTGEGATAAAEACNKAIAASGLSKTAFFAKFGTPGSN